VPTEPVEDTYLGRRDHALRPARPGDAGAIAAVHVAAWQVAYHGLLPGGYLATLSVEERAAEWAPRLRDPAAGHVLVAEVDGRVVGFAHVGAASGDADTPPYTGELFTLYLHPTEWGRGIGRGLLGVALDALAADGYRRATLWMLSTNERARRFYLRQGWSPIDGERTQEFGGQVVTDHRFGRTLEPPGPGERAGPEAQIFSRPSQ